MSLIVRRIDLLLGYTRTLRADGPSSAWRCAQRCGYNPEHGAAPMSWLEAHGVVLRVLEDGRMRFALSDGATEQRIMSVLSEHGGESIDAVECGGARPFEQRAAMRYVNELLGGVDPDIEPPPHAFLCPIHRRHHRTRECPICQSEARERRRA